MQAILDNPIYYSLSSAHATYAQRTGDVLFYPEDVAPFAGLKNNSEEEFNILHQISPKDSLFVVFSVPPIKIPTNWERLSHIDMFQLVYESSDCPTFSNQAFVNLEQKDVPAMLDLVELTKPGPFKPKTINLGNYTGFFKDEQLVSMAGHRFHPSPYIEISAVCTHPDHLGNGYAYSLLAEQIKRIVQKHGIPFLHVRNDNAGAIKLYEKLGFKIRTEMTAYVLKKA
ncbi:GNAT family N-acetyltransferase [Pedobacter sp. MW01-1-1]|uniref:GNAT family N-acetyltransferase n=1 Tax=Pedobacter sp. MW01-1-1 TaxID=3383027 RepID=UPI003FEEA61D